jgi:hypothetical protein
MNPPMTPKLKTKNIQAIMKSFSMVLSAGALALSAASAQAALYEFTWSGLTAIPNGGGISQNILVSGVTGSITDVNLSLQLDGDARLGAASGDYYAYLTYGTKTSVLLNRIGVVSDPASEFGFDDNGFNLTFDDAAASGDIHLLGNMANDDILTGSWQPDGRNVLPSAVTDATARTSLLSVFNGLLDPNGNWTFFVGDEFNSGTVGSLAGLKLSITTKDIVTDPGTDPVAVPESTAGVLLAGLLGAGWVARAWIIRGRSLPSS